MKCPTCQVDLVMTERQGIEIDYCPKCRGVWLDRGELDKIIEKSAPAPATPQHAAPTQGAPAGWQQRGHGGERGYGEHGEGGEYGEGGERGYYKGKRRKSMLGDIFDF